MMRAGFPLEKTTAATVSPTAAPAPKTEQSKATAESLAALAIYSLISFAIFGVPLLGGFSHLRLGFAVAGDPQIPMWGLAWYPWAISHRLDPFRTGYAWAPLGCTLAWSTTIPGAALLVWPLTRAAGVIASYNVLCLLTPALGAFTAFLFCRRACGNFAAATAGGLVFGFSSYVSRELLDHLSLAMVFLVPMFAYVALAQIQRDEIRAYARARFVAALVLLIIGQFLLSPEILATTALFGAAAFLAASHYYGEEMRAALKRVAVDSIAAYAISAIVLAPFLVRFFPSPFGITPIYNPSHCSSDLLNFVVPVEPSIFSRLRLSRRLAEHMVWACEPAAFVGLLPLIAILFAAKHRRDPARRTALALIIVAVATLGPILHLAGRLLLPMPWLFAMLVPLLNNALPARFTAYLFLVLAVIMSLWLAQRDGAVAGRWILGSAGIISILPALPMSSYVVRESAPSFFTQGIYRTYIARNETVLVLPFGEAGYSLLWQAEANFHFRIPQGRLVGNAIPPSFARWPIVPALAANDPYIPGYPVQFAAFLAHNHIHTVLVDSDAEKQFAPLFASLPWRRAAFGSVVLYRIDPAELLPFSFETQAAREANYQLERFALLISASRKALDSGLDPARLSLFELHDRGLISATLAGFPLRPQVPAYPLWAKLRASPAFLRMLRYVVRRGHIDYRLMAFLGRAPASALSSSGAWVGPWDGDGIAIGVVGDTGVSAVINKYAPMATRVFYPYPLEYRADAESPVGQNLLVVVFPRAALKTLGSSVQAASAPASFAH
jgi:hypothetical protein